MKAFNLGRKVISILCALVIIAGLLPMRIASAAGPNLVSNPSLETATTATSPASWQSNTWGTNTAKFDYLSTGARTGTRSVKTTISSYGSGDAKWYFTPVAVSPNTAYTFSTYYKSNIVSDLVVQATSTTGVESYTWLKSPAASSSSWKVVSANYTTPANVSKISVFHVISKVGWLQIDDVSLATTGTTTPVAPTISLTAPANNATVSGTTAISASATSTGSSVAGVQFKINGANAGSEVTSSPYTYSWDTTKVSNGNYSLTAEVRSANGLSTTSSTVTVTVSNTVTPPTDNDNLITNNSVESVDPTNSNKPLNWQSSAWGTNTPIFTYVNSGRTGTKSLTTTLTSWTNGDAKWFFTPVKVTAGKTYVYRDYYKANVNQRVVAALVDASGNYTYKELDSSPASADWNMYQATITTNANTASLTVFHLIDSVGSVTIDDAVLQVYAPSGTTDVVPNGSVEIGGSTPTGWQSSKWGTNNASFQYVTNDGFTGSRSLKVTMNSYTDGDAKWFFDPIKTLTPGKQYRFSVNYKGTVTGHPVAMFVKADGTEQYFGMPIPLNTSTTWRTYSDTFSVPTDAVSVSVFMYVNQVGYLQTDNYTISDYHANGFNRPLLTLTFDDGHEDNAITALPLLNQYGFKTTQCYATTFIEGNSQAVSDVLKFKNSGHEICSHTVTHPFMTTLSAADLDYEARHSKEYLESITGQQIKNFASPYGDYNATVNSTLMTYYQSHRTVDEGYNSKDNFNQYRLRVQNILDTTSANQVASWIAQAQADNTWLILVYHRVASNPGPYDSYTNVFAQHLATIQTSGITVKTLAEALVETKAQL